MKEVRIFEVTYRQATNTRGARVLIKDLLNNKKRVIDYDFSKNNVFEMAKEYLEGLKIEISYMGKSKKSYLLCSNDLETKLN